MGEASATTWDERSSFENSTRRPHIAFLDIIGNQVFLRSPMLYNVIVGDEFNWAERR